MTSTPIVEQTHALHELLDDGQPVAECDVLLIGCGNILRGDDAVGPTLVRALWAGGVPDGVRLVDGGTAGMDVAFQMRGAHHVVIVDAATTGSPAGTIYRVPADELEDMPPLTGLHTHSFRWDHALSLGRWLLGPAMPETVTVLLIEGSDFTPGGHLSAPVEAAMRQVIDIVREDFFPAGRGPVVEVSTDGYLRMDAETAQEYFPTGAVGGQFSDVGFDLIPLAGPAHGGGVLKQRNTAGDRSILVRELIDRDLPPGRYACRWDPSAGAVHVDVPTAGASLQ
ncbi:MAG: hydrogenase maturation protease [Nostocoides sp.]